MTQVAELHSRSTWNSTTFLLLWLFLTKQNTLRRLSFGTPWILKVITNSKGTKYIWWPNHHVILSTHVTIPLSAAERDHKLKIFQIPRYPWARSSLVCRSVCSASKHLAINNTSFSLYCYDTVSHSTNITSSSTGMAESYSFRKITVLDRVGAVPPTHDTKDKVQPVLQSFQSHPVNDTLFPPSHINRLFCWFLDSAVCSTTG